MGISRRSIANTFCLGMKDQSIDSSEAAAKATRQALHTLRDLELSGPFRRFVRSVNDTLKGDAINSLKEGFRKDVLQKMKRPIVIRKGLCLALRLRKSRDRKLAVRWHMGTFPVHYRFLRSFGLQRLLRDMEYLSFKNLNFRAWPLSRLHQMQLNTV